MCICSHSTVVFFETTSHFNKKGETLYFVGIQELMLLVPLPYP